MKPIVLYIDEEPMALRANGRLMQRYLGDEVEVLSASPEKTVDKMVEKINVIDTLVSIIIDQRLSAKGNVLYQGTELARAIRESDQKLPIYILTNYAQDIDPSLADIEYVLNKDDLSNEDKMGAIGARLRRHINIFQEILTEREFKFEGLLRKGVKESLNELEQLQFKELSFAREKKIIASELLESSELVRKFELAEKKIQEIEDLIKIRDK